MIPKIIHHIWVGNTPMPNEFEHYMEGWKSIYDDYHFLLWNDEKIDNENLIPNNLKKIYYENGLSCVFKADIVRYLIIKKYGGIYLDTDFECIRKIPDQFLLFNFLGGIQNNGEVAIGFFASIPNENLINDVVDNIIPSVESSINNGIFCNEHLYAIIGPVFFSKICKKYINKENYFFFDDKYFYPYWYTEKHRKCENFKQTSPLSYAVHHWAKSWS